VCLGIDLKVRNHYIAIEKYDKIKVIVDNVVINQ